MIRFSPLERSALIAGVALAASILSCSNGATKQDASGNSTSGSAPVCTDKDPHQCYELALRYAVDTMPAARRSAADYLRKACDRKLSQACTALGDFYLVGLGSNDSASVADSLFRVACQLKDASACNNLGDALAFGIGIPKNLDSAVYFFRLGCDSIQPSNLTACNRLGARIVDGEGVPKPDTVLARKYFERACNNADTTALSSGRGCVSLGFLITTDIDRHKTHDRTDTLLAQRIYRIYTVTCERGTTMACNNLAAMLDEGYPGVPKDTTRARALWRQACNDGEGFSCPVLANKIAKGARSRQDSMQALQLYRRACDLTDAGGCTWHARLSEIMKIDSLGVLISYQYACAMGSDWGCNNLGALYEDTYKGEDWDLQYYSKACFALSYATGCSNLAKRLEARGRTREAIRARARECSLRKSAC